MFEASGNEIPAEERMNWHSYHRLDTIYAYMREVAAAKPETASAFPIGKTFEGREILVLKIGRPKPYQKPAVFVEAGRVIYGIIIINRSPLNNFNFKVSTPGSGSALQLRRTSSSV